MSEDLENDNDDELENEEDEELELEDDEIDLDYIKEIIDNTGKADITSIVDIGNLSVEEVYLSRAMLEEEGFLEAPKIDNDVLSVWKMIFSCFDTTKENCPVSYDLIKKITHQNVAKALDNKNAAKTLYENGILTGGDKIDIDYRVNNSNKKEYFFKSFHRGSNSDNVITELCGFMNMTWLYKISHIQAMRPFRDNNDKDAHIYVKALLRMMSVIESAQQASIPLLEKMLKDVDSDTICYCRGFLEILCVLKTPEVSGMLDLDEEEDDEM